MGIAKKIIVKRTFKDYISNLDNQNSKIKFEINIIKNHLQKYSNSNYNEASWLIRSKKSVDKSISFKNYMEFGENIVELIKLFTIFKLNENKSDFSFIKELIEKEHIQGIVIGYPMHMSGDIGELCQRVHRFCQKLSHKFSKLFSKFSLRLCLLNWKNHFIDKFFIIII